MITRIPIVPPSNRGISTDKRRVQCRRRLGRQPSSRRYHALPEGWWRRETTDTFAQSPASTVVTAIAPRRIWTTWESVFPVTVVIRRRIGNITTSHIRAIIATVLASSVEWGRLDTIGLRWWCLTAIARRGGRVSERLNTMRVKSKIIKVRNLINLLLS